MNTQDLIAGYAAYTDADEIAGADGAPAVSVIPTPPTPPSVLLTIQWNC